jgi:hypothetical protein
LSVEQSGFVDVLGMAGGRGFDAGRFLLRLIKMIVRARLTQMQFFYLIFAKNLGDVQSCGVVAFLTFHGRRSPKTSQPKG